MFRTFTDAMKSVGRAYGRLPLLAKFAVIAVVLALAVVVTLSIVHLFANTCPWWPPDGCPQQD
jgi:hypothetical protein